MSWQFNLLGTNILKFAWNKHETEINESIHSYFSTNIPSFNDMKETLFCPFNKNNDKYLYYMQLLHQVYKQQFKATDEECYNDINTKYYIVADQCHTGLFATALCWLFYFTQALTLNRTFVFHGGYNFATSPYCDSFVDQHTTGKECFFLPITTCNNVTRIFQSHIENGFNYSNILIYSQRSDQIPTGFTTIFGLNTSQIQEKFKWVNNEEKYKTFDKTSMNSSVWDDYRIIYLPRGWGYRFVESFKRTWLAKTYNIEYEEYTALITSYMFRMQPYIKKPVNTIVISSLMNTKWNPLNTVSMMIRWGDKCRQANNSHPEYPAPEMDCFALSEYIEIAETLKKYLIPNISHWIVTSESKDIIGGMKNVSSEINCEIIFNLKDVLQGGSQIEFMYLTEHDAMKIMISMLSTIKLQFGAKYYLRNMGSSWNTIIYWMAKFLDCMPITVKELNEMKTSLNDDIKYDIISKYLVKFDDVKNDRMCIALNSDAFAYHRLQGKHEVSWPGVLSYMKNKKYSKEYDWEYHSNNNSFNLWNLRETVCD